MGAVARIRPGLPGMAKARGIGEAATINSLWSLNAESASREPLANRKGYNDRFQGPTVPLPVPTDSGIETVILPYTHFSVVFRPDRRLAAATTVMIDGANLIDGHP
ncbi:hypothetical protein [Streptomyces botrytidirepellens]|uniref:hypothetical protein n=1 Tax=Streptomyces botrytidirepellens TaxID=2486417 RepID=UPI001FEC8670|nr:hypothetical protein [Streptomyces botrytidirepellens]